MMEKLLPCYGRDPGRRDDCGSCEFHESCRYYAVSAPKMESRLDMISFERIQNWSELAADYQHIPGAETTEPEIAAVVEPEIPGMAQFLRFLLSIDDYTLGLLAELIGGTPERRRCFSISELAQLHHCTRQAMHRKILRSARSNPELAQLLQLAFCKVRRSRLSFRRKAPEVWRRERC